MATKAELIELEEQVIALTLKIERFRVMGDASRADRDCAGTLQINLRALEREIQYLDTRLATAYGLEQR